MSVAIQATAADPTPAVQPPPEPVCDDDVRSRYYPAAAMRRSVEGKAVVSCVVTADGKFKECVVVSEEPAGFDFGVAAVKLAHCKMRIDPTKVDPEFINKRRTIPLTFKLPTGG